MEASVGAFMGQVVSTTPGKTAHQDKLLKSTLKYQEFKYHQFIVMGFALIFIVLILKENSFITRTSLITLHFQNRDLLF